LFEGKKLFEYNVSFNGKNMLRENMK